MSCIRLAAVVCGLVISVSVVSAGPTSTAARFNHPLSSPHEASRMTAAPDTVTIVAARISFPLETPDNTFTTGLGVFDTSNGACAYIDAPPHNQSYFKHHLEFLQSYVAAASGGKTVVRIAVLPIAGTVPHTMGDYAPPTTSPTNIELARFVEDAWHAADAANPTFDFSSLDPARTFYILFHAGVGRDIDLSAQLGYNPQPQDLPSLYFNLDALRKAFGATYEGVSMHGGAHIINSAVIPETESRVINGNRTLLGINGLLASSLGSYFGLPDLFNTMNGYTAIGRFGLMDVASIFTFSGVLPPLPSAWERISLGWVTPMNLNSASTTAHTLVAQQVARNGDTTVGRLVINDREYFLLENRERNPDAHGIDLRVACGDSISSYHFTNDAFGFKEGDLSGIAGVVTGSSNHDWGMAGSGILIWHVDENIIAAHRDDNSVNASGHVRGVRLMEADGAQQIGVPVTSPFGTFISQGYDGDTWHRGNDYNFPRYSNEFSDTTQPDAHTNTNTPSGLRVNNFDTAQSHMRFDVRSASSITLAPGFPQSTGEDPVINPVVSAEINTDGNAEIFLATPNALLAWDYDGSKMIANNDPVAVFAAEPGIVLCPSIDTTSKKIFAAVQHNGIVTLVGWTPTDANHDGRADTIFRRVLSSNAKSIVTVPMVLYGKIILTVDTTIYVFDENGTPIGSHSVRGRRTGPLSPVVSMSATGTVTGTTMDSALIAINESGAHITKINVLTGDVAWSRDISLSPNSSVAVADVMPDVTGSEIVAFGDDGRGVVLSNDGNIVGTRTVQSPTTGAVERAASHPSFVEPQTIVAGGAAHLFALNANGSSRSNYPVALPAGVSGTPISCGELGLDFPLRTPTNIVATKDGILHGLNASEGREEEGFPLALGSVMNGTPAAAPGRLYAATSAGTLFAFNGRFLQSEWPQFLHDPAHTSFKPRAAPGTTATTFFPKDRVFNWPNPVRNKYTRIRFYVGSSAVVHVKITNLANELVMELPEYAASGGVDNEIELHTGQIQSGVYIVRVEATGNNGQNDVAFIKMAVVN